MSLDQTVEIDGRPTVTARGKWHPALYSSVSDEWPTPRDFFAKLNRRYRFTLDPCATPDNAKCPLYFTKEQDGLAQDWGTHRVFCNPPFGRVGKWAAKCFEASQQGALVVLLAAARTDTKWFHQWVQGKAKVTFLRGRLQFGTAENSAPFPSMLAVYSPSRPAMTCANCGNGFVARSDARTCSSACRQRLYRQRRGVTANV
jgi:site-specific DNA-methyltransferase (adenine-specific)